MTNEQNPGKQRQRVDADLMKEMKHFGVGEWDACFHCGNCTAVCNLTEKNLLFPRKGIRYMQMGLKEKLAGSVEPWMCYYCGGCSETCPRDANPGEMMMSLRRYLTSVYDWTGISGKLYKSKGLHITVIALMFTFIFSMFLIFAQVPDLNNPEVIRYLESQTTTASATATATVSASVPLNLYAPTDVILNLDHIQLVLLSLFLLGNIINMYYKVVIKDKSVSIPLWLYVKELGEAVWNFLTQWQFKKCDRKSYWVTHLLLMMGYIIMFGSVVLFLDWFQTDKIHPVTHPQRWLGYLATFGLIFATLRYAIGRIRKKEPVFKFTHHSDWIFLFLLFMIALTGILVHLFRINGMAEPTYYMYAIHLAFEVPMVFTFVAFSKWSHLAYRPFALYLFNLKKSARRLEEKRRKEAVPNPA